MRRSFKRPIGFILYSAIFACGVETAPHKADTAEGKRLESTQGYALAMCVATEECTAGSDCWAFYQYCSGTGPNDCKLKYVSLQTNPFNNACSCTPYYDGDQYVFSQCTTNAAAN